MASCYPGGGFPGACRNTFACRVSIPTGCRFTGLPGGMHTPRPEDLISRPEDPFQLRKTPLSSGILIVRMTPIAAHLKAKQLLAALPCRGHVYRHFHCELEHVLLVGLHFQEQPGHIGPGQLQREDWHRDRIRFHRGRCGNGHAIPACGDGCVAAQTQFITAVGSDSSTS